jgi:hypothetical protein
LFDFGVYPSEIEETPAEPCNGSRLKCFLAEHISGIDGLVAEQCRERNPGIILSDCLPNPGVGGRDLSLRSDDVRAAPEETGRFAGDFAKIEE